MFAHLALVHREDRTKFNESLKVFFLFLLLAFHLLLSCTLRINSHLCRFCYSCQSAIRSKVKYITIRFLTAIQHSMGLNTENCLHVICSRGILRTLHAQYSSPFRDGHTSSKLTTWKCYGTFLGCYRFLFLSTFTVWVGAWVIASNVVFNFSQCTAILILNIAVTSCIDDMETQLASFTKYLIFFKNLLQSSSFFHTRQ